MAGIGHQRIVTAVTALGGDAHRVGPRQRIVESRQPLRAERTHRGLDEILHRKRQHHIQSRAAPQQGLGKEQVGACGERAIGAADAVVVDRPLDRGDQRRLVARLDAMVLALAGDHVAGVVGHRRRREPVQRRLGQALRRQQPAQLAHAAGQVRVAAATGLQRGGNQSTRAVQVAEHQPCLDRGRQQPVGIVTVGEAHGVELWLDRVEHLAGNSACRRRVACQQAQRGQVDPREVAVDIAGGFCQGPCASVLLRGRAQQRQLVLAAVPERLALEQAAAQGQVFDLVACVQSIFDELAPGRRQGAGIAQVQHRPVRQRPVAREILQTLQCQVISAEELAVVLETADLRQPVVQRPVGGRGHGSVDVRCLPGPCPARSIGINRRPCGRGQPRASGACCIPPGPARCRPARLGRK